MQEQETEVIKRPAAGYTPNSTIMEKARTLLTGKWWLCVGITLIYFFISGALSGLKGTGGLVSLILSGPLALGICIFYLNIIRNNNAEFTNILDGFNRFAVSCLSYILMIVFVLLWSLLLIIPGIIAAFSYFFALAPLEAI